MCVLGAILGLFFVNRCFSWCEVYYGWGSGVVVAWAILFCWYQEFARGGYHFDIKVVFLWCVFDNGYRVGKSLARTIYLFGVWIGAGNRIFLVWVWFLVRSGFILLIMYLFYILKMRLADWFWCTGCVFGWGDLGLNRRLRTCNLGVFAVDFVVCWENNFPKF